MRWQNRRQSGNVQNRGRGRRAGGAVGGGLLLGLIVLLLTGNPLAALQVGLGGAQMGGDVVEESVSMSRQQEELYAYASVVLADTEDCWNSLLPQYGLKYREPTLNIFQDTVKTGCGIASSGVGPFYCPADESVYLDLSFYGEMQRKYDAGTGDFIMSYIISHEVGHHVQNLFGISERVHAQRGRISEAAYNDLSVRMELQADYLAGVVARYQEERGYLESGDIEEAIRAAWAVGDDKLQQQAQGTVTPESFTHGTSEQRMRWYQKGYEAGDLSAWDTFSATEL